MPTSYSNILYFFNTINLFINRLTTTVCLIQRLVHVPQNNLNKLINRELALHPIPNKGQIKLLNSAIFERKFVVPIKNFSYLCIVGVNNDDGFGKRRVSQRVDSNTSYKIKSIRQVWRRWPFPISITKIRLYFLMAK